METGSVRPLIVVVDDEELLRTWLRENLVGVGYAVETAGTGEEALRLVENTDPGVVLLDLRLPDADGLDLLARFREHDRDLIVIIVTAYGEVETAVEAVKSGAYDFLEKPVDLEKLFIIIEKGLETRRLRQQIATFRVQHRWLFANVELVGRSPAMQEIAEAVEKVARAGSTAVLLEGESGVGKDLVARAIHAQSDRRDFPFLEINCTALPEHLAESELFGHERGAFTDARERKKGLFELAHRGTLFLDEMGDMPLGSQAKILRFLEDARFRRVGGTADIQVDVRVIAATNRDLERLVDQGEFRSDLYFRLSVVPIRIPPLRERPEDVAPLAHYFVERLARELRHGPVSISDSAMEAFEGYAWPGNVRQLRNFLERILIMEETDEILPSHLPFETRGPQTVDGGVGRMYELPRNGLNFQVLERNLIEQALERTGGNVTRSAELLGLTRDALRYRMEKFGLLRATSNPE